MRLILRHSFLSIMSSSSKSNNNVNILDLAAACVACTESASQSIQQMIASKNTRLKNDGSFVTDADFTAQGAIFKAVRSISADIDILGEESAEEMSVHMEAAIGLEASVLERTKREMRLRFHQMTSQPMPLSADHGPNDEDINPQQLPDDPDDIDVSRLRIIVDPLDGTKSYAHGEFEAVSILIAIMLDDQPYFGVIGKPFGYRNGFSPMLGGSCVTFYGGPLLHGVYLAGGERIEQAGTNGAPTSVISRSRSKGVVHDFCVHLSKLGYIHSEPMLVSGAGEKSLRLILQTNQEALWFYPKAGTSLWDVAAPDALLRSLNGKLTNKYGEDIDYAKSRDEAENKEGVVACTDLELHAKCISLFQEGDWLQQM